ncbi:hypothetical protein B9Z55_016462 [Caenorhabditis nigoni]|uniref:Uncharacterized protein n=1 Tax=Caenorhabditis nigoni TaxID=1611254 RepID=A0A2G5T5J7_9PELO|nr:hypothetical protein B9Z55_016462 [Caenorhabditis nigoni]
MYLSIRVCPENPIPQHFRKQSREFIRLRGILSSCGIQENTNRKRSWFPILKTEFLESKKRRETSLSS